MDTVVTATHVSKKYCRGLKQGIVYTVADVTRDLLGLPGRSHHLRAGEFWSVDDVSFELKRGESLGIIGANGAGKSTLLKMISGILRPDRGSLRICGRVGALIEVGAGFHPLLTGRENVYVNGAILGMSKREIDRKYDEIVEFSGLDAGVLEAPVRTYSSGMHVRLGFAVAAHADADILLIDEVLAVGDASFYSKCYRRLHALKEQGVSIVLVSHNNVAQQELCSRALLLEDGNLLGIGKTTDIINLYRSRLADISREPRAVTPVHHVREYEWLQMGPISVVDAAGARLATPYTGQRVSVRFTVHCARPVERPHYQVGFYGADNPFYTSFATDWEGLQPPSLHPGSTEVTLHLPVLGLPVGGYAIVALIGDGSTVKRIACRDKIESIFVRQPNDVRGDLAIPHSWAWRNSADVGAHIELASASAAIDRSPAV